MWKRGGERGWHAANDHSPDSSNILESIVLGAHKKSVIKWRKAKCRAKRRTRARTSHCLNLHFCLILLGPPNFFMSLQKSHRAQSSVLLQGSHSPHIRTERFTWGNQTMDNKNCVFTSYIFTYCLCCETMFYFLSCFILIEFKTNAQNYETEEKQWNWWLTNMGNKSDFIAPVPVSIK